MNKIRPSALERLASCPTSAALPEVGHVSPYSAKGNAVHAFLADYLTNGESAYERVPSDYASECKAIDVSRLPVGVGTVNVEVPLDRNGIQGTADVVGIASDGKVVVIDWKTGHAYQTPARQHVQALWYAVAAAQKYSADSAIVGIGRIRDDGRVWIDTATLDMFDLEEASVTVDAIIDRARKAQATDKVTTGEHCKYCPAFTSCPATTALARMIGEDARMIGEEVRLDLSPATAARAWERVKLAERIVEETKAALKVYAETVGPFDLANGKRVGMVETTRRSIDGNIAFGVLREKYGVDVAHAAVTFEPSASFSSIEAALKSVAEKGKLAAMKRDAEAAIEAAGAIKTNSFTSVKEFTPKKELENA